MTITFTIRVQGVFAHATAMQMLVSPTVTDQTEGDSNDDSGRSGHVPPFSSS